VHLRWEGALVCLIPMTQMVSFHRCRGIIESSNVVELILCER